MKRKFSSSNSNIRPIYPPHSLVPQYPILSPSPHTPAPSPQLPHRQLSPHQPPPPPPLPTQPPNHSQSEISVGLNRPPPPIHPQQSALLQPPTHSQPEMAQGINRTPQAEMGTGINRHPNTQQSQQSNHQPMLHQSEMGSGINRHSQMLHTQQLPPLPNHQQSEMSLGMNRLQQMLPHMQQSNHTQEMSAVLNHPPFFFNGNYGQKIQNYQSSPFSSMNGEQNKRFSNNQNNNMFFNNNNNNNNNNNQMRWRPPQQSPMHQSSEQLQHQPPVIFDPSHPPPPLSMSRSPLPLALPPPPPPSSNQLNNQSPALHMSPPLRTNPNWVPKRLGAKQQNKKQALLNKQNQKLMKLVNTQTLLTPPASGLSIIQSPNNKKKQKALKKKIVRMEQLQSFGEMQGLNDSIAATFYDNEFPEELEYDGEMSMTVNKKAKRKPMSTRYTRKKEWNREDAIKALVLENEFHKLQRLPMLILKFPDPDLNKDIVKGFSPFIENVHFQQPSTPRYCFAQLRHDSDIDAVKEHISKIPFGSAKIVVEKKNTHCEDRFEVPPEDIDPYTLYIGNLPTNVSVSTVKVQFPTAARIDIGYAQRMKYTRYAFIRYHNVEDAMEAYRTTFNSVMESRSLIVRFRRSKGNVGMPGGEGRTTNKNELLASVKKNATVTATSSEMLPTSTSAPTPPPSPLLSSLTPSPASDTDTNITEKSVSEPENIVCSSTNIDFEETVVNKPAEITPNDQNDVDSKMNLLNRITATVVSIVTTTTETTITTETNNSVTNEVLQENRQNEATAPVILSKDEIKSESVTAEEQLRLYQIQVKNEPTEDEDEFVMDDQFEEEDETEDEFEVPDGIEDDEDEDEDHEDYEDDKEEDDDDAYKYDMYHWDRIRQRELSVNEEKPDVQVLDLYRSHHVVPTMSKIESSKEDADLDELYDNLNPDDDIEF